MVTPESETKAAPPPKVLAAFGVAVLPTPLAGGLGTSYRAGDLVLKPDTDAELIQWWVDVAAILNPKGVTIPSPVRSRDGRLVVDGWSVTNWVPGTPVDAADTTAESWLPVLKAGRALQLALREVPRPNLIDERHHRWALADRTAWGEGTQPLGPTTAQLLTEASNLVVEEQLPAQLIHADLSGNVLLDHRHPPAVLDISPYWRPAEYADAVVVVDALLWWDSDPALISLAQPKHVGRARWQSLLTRAWTFRLLAYDESRREPTPDVINELNQYRTVLRLITDHA